MAFGNPGQLDKKRVLALDGFRGIAILLVIAYHYLPFASAGWCGVDLFFVLSGFLITWKLKDSLTQKNYYKYFYIRRILRIVPLYLLMLLVIFFIAPYAFPSFITPSYKELLTHQGWYWTFTQNIYDAKHGWPSHIIIIHFWSLATEMQFYLLWPFFLRLTKNAPNLLIVLLILLVVFANVFRALGSNYWGFSNVYQYVLLPSRIDSFAIGCLLYLLVTKYGEQLKSLYLFISLTLFALLFVLFAFFFDVHFTSPFTREYGYTIFDLFWASLIGYILVSNTNIVNRYVFQGKLLTTMGKYSYGMYVFHLPLWVVINSMIKTRFLHAGRGLQGHDIYIPLTIFAITFFVSVLSFYCFEDFFLKRKWRFSNE